MVVFKDVCVKTLLQEPANMYSYIVKVVRIYDRFVINVVIARLSECTNHKYDNHVNIFEKQKFWLYFVW